jgi:hypothetical protein
MDTYSTPPRGAPRALSFGPAIDEEYEGSGRFRRLELAADRFFDVERVLAIVVGKISVPF